MLCIYVPVNEYFCTYDVCVIMMVGSILLAQDD